MASIGSNIVDNGWEIYHARRPCNIVRHQDSEEVKNTTKPSVAVGYLGFWLSVLWNRNAIYSTAVSPRYLLIAISELGEIFVDLIAVKIYIVLFWIVTPCNLVGGYRHFGTLCIIRVTLLWWWRQGVRRKPCYPTYHVSRCYPESHTTRTVVLWGALFEHWEDQSLCTMSFCEEIRDV